MLDPVLLRTNPAELAASLRASRGFELDVARIEALEAQRKQLQVRTQELQNLRNTRSKQIGMLKAKGEDVSAVMAEVAGFGEELKASEIRLDELRGEIEFGRNAVPRAPVARIDVPANERLDLLERCGGLRDHRGILGERQPRNSIPDQAVGSSRTSAVGTAPNASLSA